MLILLPLVILCACLLTKVGANPYLCGAATVTVGLVLHQPNNMIIVLVVGAYVASYFSYVAHELGGVSADLNTTLAGTSQHVSQKAIVLATFLRVVIFVLGFVLPIGKPSAYVTGAGAIALASILIVCSSNRRGADLIIMLIQGVLYGVMFWFVERFGFELDVVPALIAGMGVAKHLYSKYEDVEVELDQVIVPGVVRAGFILGLTWLTPGLSFGLVGNALLPSSKARGVWLAGLSAGIEGWALKTLLNGSVTGKTMLADLLSDQLGAGRYSFDWSTRLWICVALSLAVVVSVGLLRFKSWLEPARELSMFLLVLEGGLAVGAWIIPFIMVGCLVQWFKVKSRGSDRGLATGFLVPVIMG